MKNHVQIKLKRWNGMNGNTMTGWIISNGGLRLEKFTEQLDWLEKTMLNCGMLVTQVRNHELTAGERDGNPVLYYHGHERGIAPVWLPGSSSKPDFVFFWDKDVRLASHMERIGFRLFNSSSAIAACDDKSMTHRLLSGHAISMPDTLVAPFFYPGAAPGEDGFTEQAEALLGYPVIVKESFGSFGTQVHLAKNHDEFQSLHKRMQFIPHLCQRYISSSHGRDARLQVVGSHVVAAMLRHSDTDFRANISSGGIMEPFDPPESFREMAIRATFLLGADFAGVDILFGPDGDPVLCEVNSNAHMRNIYECTGVDVPLHIAKHIAGKINGPAISH
jgi:gamma-F420-2:alpha-L-glutamate ligase